MWSPTSQETAKISRRGTRRPPLPPWLRPRRRTSAWEWEGLDGPLSARDTQRLDLRAWPQGGVRDGRAAARVRRHLRRVRRRHRARAGGARGGGRWHPRADRPERCRQVDAVQRGMRARAAEGRRGASRRPRHHAHRAASPRPAADGAHLPATGAVRRAVRLRQHPHRRGDPARLGARRSDPAKDAEEVLERIGLSELRDERVDALSTGIARLVEVARALRHRPRCCCSTSRRPASTSRRRTRWVRSCTG